MENRAKYFIHLSALREVLRTEQVKHYDASFDKMQNLLAMNQNLQIELTETDTALSIKHLQLSYVNQLRITWQDYKIIIFFTIAALILLAAILLKLRHKMFLRSKSREIYQMIAQQLQANVSDSYDHGLTEDTIMETISGSLGGQVARNIWPYLEQMRREDPRTCKFEVLVGGRPHVLWQWKSNAVGGRKMKVG